MENNVKKSVVYCYEEEQLKGLLEERKIVINDEIDERLIESAVLHILKWNKEDLGKEVEEREPIKVYVNSVGGSVADGYALIDAITNSKTPVYTINIGMAYSMGFLIMLAGSKRYGLPHATYLLHDGSSVMYNSMSKLNDTANFYKELEKKIKGYVLGHSKLTPAMYNKKYGAEWYMFGEDAKKHGFIDYIVGVDCDMDVVV